MDLLNFAGTMVSRLKHSMNNSLEKTHYGSYVIGYNDGYLFGGHEIDVDSKGIIKSADVR